MVLEALLAIGLAGNVVQFIQFSCELISSSSEISKSADGFSSGHADLQKVADALKEHSFALQSASSSSEQLKDLAKRSGNIAENLGEAVIKIRDVRRKHPKWGNFRQALESVWRRDQIADLQSRLELLRDQMEFHLISEMRGAQVNMDGSLLSLRESNIQLKLEFTEKLTRIAETFRAIDQRFATFQSPISLKEIGNSFNQYSMSIEGMAQISAVLKSLQFESMSIRHASIIEAHKRTFDWIFSTDSLPQDDPRSAIKFSTWLRSGTGIFWVTGKPGSGKSTLMKYLDCHSMSVHLLREWAGPSRLVTASFYFWNPGTVMQKSLQGLLQSLLYCILSSCPELIEALCADRWNSGRYNNAACSPWHLPELRHAFELLKAQRKLSAKFYFHIDGLDEYEGDHYEVIQVIQDLSECADIKLCVSSRPWIQFQDTLGESNHGFLQLHTLTESDIELFARDNISLHRKRFTSKAHEQYTELVHEIRNRAQGVFLWVRLVVRSLRDGLINEDQVSLLRKRLEELPTDLEEFFEHMLNSVDLVYRERMAQTFLAALAATEPLALIHYSFLEEEDPAFGWDLTFSPMPREEIWERIEQARRRLTGRYKGLLEPSPDDSVVDFLHRTLRDFLNMPRMRSFFKSQITVEFNASEAVVRVLLGEVKYICKRPSPRNFAKVLKAANVPETAGEILEYSVLDQVETMCRWFWPPITCSGIDFQDIMMIIAIHIGREDYVEYALARSECPEGVDRALMHAVLCHSNLGSFASVFEINFGICENEVIMENQKHPSSCKCLDSFAVSEFSPANELSVKLARTLLEKGANPNKRVTSISRSILRQFLDNYFEQLVKRHRRQDQEILQLMIIHSADIQSHISSWVRFAQEVRFLPREPFEQSIQSFCLLLDYGMRPYAHQDGNSVWVDFMWSVLRNDQSKENSGAIGTLIRKFLRRGAKIESLRLRPAYDKGTMSWFDALFSYFDPWKFSLCALQPRLIFGIFLQHGMDPNSFLDGDTIWEQLLALLCHGINEHGNTYSYRCWCYDLIILFLSYRADPWSAKLDQIVAVSDKMDPKVQAVKQEIQRAIDDRKSQEQYGYPPEKRSDQGSAVYDHRHSILSGHVQETGSLSGQRPYWNTEPRARVSFGSKRALSPTKQEVQHGPKGESGFKKRRA